MTRAPENLFGEIASELDPIDAEELVANRSFREVVELAYHAGWRDHEQTVIDQLSETRLAWKRRFTNLPGVSP